MSLSSEWTQVAAMMKAITALTAGYMLIVAAVMFYTSDAGARLSGVAFGEVAFSLPMIMSCVLSFYLRIFEARCVVFTFGAAFSIFSMFMFYSTFVGEHDAQCQLALLLIPFVGFPAVAISGVIAALWNWSRLRSR